MKWLIFRVMVKVVLVFSVAILAIQAQPYHESALAEVLMTPDVCAAPCFVGIRPGITRTEEAITLLEKSGWVDKLLYFVNALPQVTWRWNDAAPPIFRQMKNNYGGGLRIQAGVVQYIEIRTEVMFGEAWLQWGMPRATSYAYTMGPPGYLPPVPFLYIYDDFLVIVPTQCPYLRRFRESKSTFILGDTVAWLAHHFISKPLDRVSPTSMVADMRRGLC